MGFVFAVHETLKRLGRQYYYAGKVPPFLHADHTDSVGEPIPEDFESAYAQFEEGDVPEMRIRQTPHCIIHSFRKYPAKMRFAGTTDAPGGSRRQKMPNDFDYHEDPIPESRTDATAEDYPGSVVEEEGRVDAFDENRSRPPLWDDIDQVPDIIRDMMEKDTTCFVAPYNYDVFVDFSLVAPNLSALYRMERDVSLILYTFHNRAITGASNLAGWFYQSVDGAPPRVEDNLPDQTAVRTITWRLKQTEAFAFPVDNLEEIHLDLHGPNHRPSG